MKFLLGTKEKMTTIYTQDGRAFAATIVNAAPSVVTQIKTKEKEGYNAVQIGAIEKKEKRVNKPQVGHAKLIGKGTALRYFREIRARDGGLPKDVELGAAISVFA